MLVVNRKRSWAVYVPVVPSTVLLLWWVGGGWLAVRAIPHYLEAISIALVAVASPWVVYATAFEPGRAPVIRWVRARGDEIAVAGPFVKNRRFARARCALGIELAMTTVRPREWGEPRGFPARGVHYRLYLTDADARQPIALWSSENRAERGRERLSRAILGERSAATSRDGPYRSAVGAAASTESPARAAEEKVAEVEAAWKEAQARARAELGATDLQRWRQVAWFLAIAVLVAALAGIVCLARAY